MSLLSPPNDVIIKIGHDILDVGWDYEASRWKHGDAKNLLLFRLVQPRIAHLCGHLACSEDIMVPIMGDNGVADERILYSYARMGLHTPHLAITLDVFCGQRAAIGVPCHVYGRACDDPLDICEQYDRVIADRISHVTEATSANLTLCDDNEGTAGVEYYPLTYAAVFGTPSLRYLVLSLRGTVDLRVLAKYFPLWHKVDGLRVQYVYSAYGYVDHNLQRPFWQALLKLPLRYSLDVDMSNCDFVKDSRTAMGTPPLHSPSWSCFTYLRIKGINKRMTDWLQPAISANLSASASTLKDVWVPASFFAYCDDGTIFLMLERLSLEDGDGTTSFEVLEGRLSKCPVLQDLSLTGPLSQEIAYKLIKQSTFLPVLQMLSVSADADTLAMFRTLEVSPLSEVTDVDILLQKLLNLCYYRRINLEVQLAMSHSI
ncbi:hypothetical protein EMMF5_001330 [Cystobasidiomycetes sp. EMM_F5]